MGSISLNQIASQLQKRGYIEIPHFLSQNTFAFKPKRQVIIGKHSVSIAPSPKYLQQYLSSLLGHKVVTKLIVLNHGDYVLLNSSLLKPFRGLIDLSDAKNTTGYLGFIKNQRETLQRYPTPKSLFLYTLPNPFIKYVDARVKGQVRYLFFA